MFLQKMEASRLYDIRDRESQHGSEVARRYSLSVNTPYVDQPVSLDSAVWRLAKYLQNVTRGRTPLFIIQQTVNPGHIVMRICVAVDFTHFPGRAQTRAGRKDYHRREKRAHDNHGAESLQEPLCVQLSFDDLKGNAVVLGHMT